ncbi:glutathione peroxidase [Sandaracinus amylolyticus]|uniref:Glutathione peroxidase n=1 Tax=Sandaracinus amylolyticus TaxID=927083 RepID=A0A0F6SI75_9BACT|nr:glutathione peroxidase [Sandaracinus amylolyticus]AKF11704.1 Glutathione peroxidase family protein [Sandaracinus amylolyticus]
MTTLHDFQVKTIDGATKSLADYRGKALLVVNVASQCGLTPQYSKLQSLYEQYGAKGAEVLGFPCNQFMGQEPGTENEIKTFCETSYGVTFPLFSKIEVNGGGAHPLYQWLKGETGGGDIQWNFEKFVVGKDGRVVERFSPKTAPDDPKIVAALQRALG